MHSNLSIRESWDELNRLYGVMKTMENNPDIYSEGEMKQAQSEYTNFVEHHQYIFRSS